MKQFYRSKKRIVPDEGDTEVFRSINAAKRRSRELQKSGVKFVHPLKKVQS